MRCFKQAHQHGGLLRQVGLGAEVIACQINKAEIDVAGEFPGHVEVDVLRQRVRRRHQLSRVGLVKLQQHIGRFHFHAFARLQLDLRRAVGLRHHTTSKEFSGVFKKGMHRGAIVNQS